MLRIFDTGSRMYIQTFTWTLNVGLPSSFFLSRILSGVSFNSSYVRVTNMRSFLLYSAVTQGFLCFTKSIDSLPSEKSKTSPMFRNEGLLNQSYRPVITRMSFSELQ